MPDSFARLKPHALLAMLALAGLFVLVTSVACGDDDDPDTTPPVNTPTVVNPTPTKPAEPTAVPTKPVATPTVNTSPDKATVDKIAAAVTSGDKATLKLLIQYTKVNCITTPQGLGAPPLCPAGVANGTAIDVFPSSTCEGEYIYPDRIDPVIDRMVAGRPKLWGAFKRLKPEGTPTFPAGSVGIIFARQDSVAGAPVGIGESILVDAGKIVSTRFGCLAYPLDLAGTDPTAREWIVPPQTDPLAR